MNRTRLLVVAALVLLGLIALNQVGAAWQAAARLQADNADLKLLRGQLSEIRDLSDAPTIAALQVESPELIPNRIDQALARAGLTSRVFAGHTPAEPRRMGTTDFVQRSVDISLNGCTVAQIAAFAQSLRADADGTVVRDLQLHSPSQRGNRELWDCELVLTQVVFSPKSDS